MKKSKSLRVPILLKIASLFVIGQILSLVVFLVFSNNYLVKKAIEGSEATLFLDGWLDTQAAPELQAELEKLGENVQNLVIDMKGLEYISSSGVRQVVSAYKKMNGNLTVKNVSESIMNIFKVTGIDKRINFQ